MDMLSSQRPGPPFHQLPSPLITPTRVPGREVLVAELEFPIFDPLVQPAGFEGASTWPPKSAATGTTTTDDMTGPIVPLADSDHAVM